VASLLLYEDLIEERTDRTNGRRKDAAVIPDSWRSVLSVITYRSFFGVFQVATVMLLWLAYFGGGGS